MTQACSEPCILDPKASGRGEDGCQGCELTTAAAGHGHRGPLSLEVPVSTCPRVTDPRASLTGPLRSQCPPRHAHWYDLGSRCKASAPSLTRIPPTGLLQGEAPGTLVTCCPGPSRPGVTRPAQTCKLAPCGPDLRFPRITCGIFSNPPGCSRGLMASPPHPFVLIP